MGTSWCGEKVLDCFTLACEKDHVCRVYTVSESAEKESVPRLKIGVWSKIEKAVCFHRRSVRQKHNEKKTIMILSAKDFVVISSKVRHCGGGIRRLGVKDVSQSELFYIKGKKGAGDVQSYSFIPSSHHLSLPVYLPSAYSRPLRPSLSHLHCAGTNRISHVIQGAHEGSIFALCMLRNGTLVSGGKDRRLISWDSSYQQTQTVEVRKHKRSEANAKFINYT